MIEIGFEPPQYMRNFPLFAKTNPIRLHGDQFNMTWPFDLFQRTTRVNQNKKLVRYSYGSQTNQQIVNVTRNTVHAVGLDHPSINDYTHWVTFRSMRSNCLLAVPQHVRLA